MDILEDIKTFADRAHGNQIRKYTPERYIVHPIRVMETCRSYGEPITVLAAALLHDVLEDTDVSEQELLLFLTGLMEKHDADKTLRLVKELTDVYVKADYPE